MTGSEAGSYRAMVGRPASGGRLMRSSRSRRSRAAKSMSVPHRNWRVMSDRPGREREVTCCTPCTTAMASSMGREMRFSTSRGPTPGYSVSMETVGKERSGRRSTWSRE
jgi:hypothetical protein